MQALRAHPFFSSIDWKALWTDPAPPLEHGLVKKEHPLGKGDDPNWEDVGAVWDDLVGGDGKDNDEISWAADAERPPFLFGRRSMQRNGSPHSHEEGPMGEPTRYNLSIEPRHDDEDTATIIGHSSEVVPVDVPSHPRIPKRSGSGSSSSEGSPTEKLGATLENLVIDRGRNRVQTPLQGNVQLSDSDWYVLPSVCPFPTEFLQIHRSSIQLPGETIIFTSLVEARSLKRRASMLLSLSVAPIKPKMRQLILTSHRILCLKRQHKSRRAIAVKTEYLLSPPEKGKDKESRPVVTSVQSKGEREFVLLTVSLTARF